MNKSTLALVLASLMAVSPISAVPAQLANQKHGKVSQNDKPKGKGRVLKKAFQIGKADGHLNPEVIQAIVLQESLAGELKGYKVGNPGPNAYFGLAQIKLGTARDVLKRYPQVAAKHNVKTTSNADIVANLMHNESFNMEVASKYLLMLNRGYGYSGRKLLNAYNRGPAGVRRVSDRFHYAIQAEQKLADWKRSAGVKKAI